MASNGFANAHNLPLSLLDLLSTTVVLDHVVAHLPLAALFALSATSKTFQKLVLQTPGVFRYLDLSSCRGAEIKSSEPIDPGGNIWRSERMDEALTEDEFYSGPLRGIFSNLRKRKLLQDVQVLVLDGLSITIELVNEIVTSDDYAVRLLSVVGCRNLNYGKLQQLLRYLCRPERPKGTPRLKGIYVLPKKRPLRLTGKNSSAAVTGVMSVSKNLLGGSPDDVYEDVPNDEAWWNGCGQVIDLPRKQSLRAGWEQTLNACEGIIAFDGILCPNKEHFSEGFPTGFRPLATVSLPTGGCASCGRYPQLQDGPLRWLSSPAMAFPLLSPLPHSGRIEVAAAPPHSAFQSQGLVASCEECLNLRWCLECNRYWCHHCYPGPRPESAVGSDEKHDGMSRMSGETLGTIKKPPVSRDCWECGLFCPECQEPRRRNCRGCKTTYCRLHNIPCDDFYCEWCRCGGMRTNELY